MEDHLSGQADDDQFGRCRSLWLIGKMRRALRPGNIILAALILKIYVLATRYIKTAFTCSGIAAVFNRKITLN